MSNQPPVGQVIDIAIKQATRAPMILQGSVMVTSENGIEGDYRGRAHLRQVTVLAREAWEQACVELNASLPWTHRRANLLVQGLDMEGTIGQRLRIGELLLEITGETKPCERMDEAFPGLRAALTPDWRGGVTCTVLEAGQIAIGDRVEVEDD